ncbi:ccr4-not transcription complex subunit 4 [Quercus suber]|uniref:Ccr4-not transcription complex subunit 4 n=1 Tax=Quercus suber TaxID=58331 RepID=A0AAW0M1M3_QUESU
MVSNSITTASMSSGPNARDLGKKKRANRSAKLKQCKLDARREQWLSQGTAKNKGCKEEQNDGVQSRKGVNSSLKNLEMSSRGEEMEGSMLIHQYSDLDSPANSPTRDDGCLDDWEAVADALVAENQNPCSESSLERESVAELVSSREANDGVGLGGGDLKPECPKMVLRGACGNSQAWRPDDAFRPRSLPNLSKQQSLPNPDRHYGRGAGGVTWGCNKVVSMPTSCPICYEDLDFTDSSFLPCLCGFRLCLFCHKRILEEDGRCPGCRKPYETDAVEAETSVHGGSLTFRLARSCSMIARS